MFVNCVSFLILRGSFVLATSCKRIWGFFKMLIKEQFIKYKQCLCSTTGSILNLNFLLISFYLIFVYFSFFFGLYKKVYPKRFCRASLRPYDNGSVKRVTIPSGPKTFDGILSNESESERESDWSCKLKNICFFFGLSKKKHN